MAKEIFIIHKFKDEVIVQGMFLPLHDEYDPLTVEDLEDIFLRHNLYTKAFSLTGYGLTDYNRDYVYDPYRDELWRCEPIGWTKIK